MPSFWFVKISQYLTYFCKPSLSRCSRDKNHTYSDLGNEMAIVLYWLFIYLTFCSVYWYIVQLKVPITLHFSTRNMHCSILYTIMAGYKYEKSSQLTGHKGKYAMINGTEMCTSYQATLYRNTLPIAFWPLECKLNT
jgi:hypothetical protein